MNIFESLDCIVICLSYADGDAPSANRIALERGLRIKDLHQGPKRQILARLGSLAKYDETENTVKFDSSTLESKLENFTQQSLEDAQYYLEKVADDATDSLEVESVLEYLLGKKLGVRFAYDDCKQEGQIIYAERLYDFVRNTAYKGGMYVTGIYYYGEA